MSDPFKNLFRRRALRRHASTVSTGLVPLSSVRRAVVYIAPSTQAVEVLSARVRAFFAEKQIALQILCPKARELNWYGRIRRPHKSAPAEAEDLFISLAGPDSFAATFAAVSSPARFKVGRSQLPGQVFDLVVCDRQDVDESSITVFQTMTRLLNQIQ